MKQLSPEASELVRALQTARPTWFLGSARIKVLDRVALFPEPALIPYIAPIMFHGSSSERAKTAQIIRGLLDTCPASDLPHLDEAMRRGWWSGGDFKKVTGRELARMVGPDLPGLTLPEIASMHPNGYVREAAVKRLAMPGRVREIPFLILRLNDWVPAIRQAARSSIESRLDNVDPEVLFESMPVLIWLERAARDNHKDILVKIFDILKSKVGLDRLKAGVRGADNLVRRKCWGLLVNSQLMSREELFSIGWASSDIAIRASALAILAAEEIAEFDWQVLLAALADRCGSLRRQGLRMLLDRYPGRALYFLEKALFDRSAAVRATARFHIAGFCEIDIPNTYRTLIAQKGLLLEAAIAGLGEVGTVRDADFLVPYLRDGSSRLRRAAIRAIMKLSADDHVEHAWDLFLDPSPGVSKESARLLRPFVDRVGGARLLSIAQTATARTIWQNAINLLAGLPKWEAPIWLMPLVWHADADRRDCAEAAMQLWSRRFNVSQQMPTLEQRLQLAKEVLRLGSRTSEHGTWPMTLRFALE